MFVIPNEKDTMHQGVMPQVSTPTATCGHENEFLPKYEEAINTNLRNFDQLEGQEGGGEHERSQQPKQKMPRWKRCLLFGLPLILVMAAVTATTVVLFEKKEQQPAASIDNSTLLSTSLVSTSLTLTKRHTVTITTTQTFTAPIAPSIAASISAFYASWSASIASELSEISDTIYQSLRTTTPLPTIDIGPSSKPTSTVPLPTINMDPSSAPPPPQPTSATPAPVVPFSTPVTLTTSSQHAPLGQGFCGLPGTFCMERKRDADHDKEAQASEKTVTVWKHLNFTITTTSTSTKAPFSAYIMDAYNSYLEQSQKSILSATASFTGSVLSPFSSVAPPPETTTIAVPTMTTVFAEPPPFGYCAPGAPHFAECLTMSD